MMLFPAVLMNFPNSEVCLIGEWSIAPLLFVESLESTAGQTVILKSGSERK